MLVGYGVVGSWTGSSAGSLEEQGKGLYVIIGVINEKDRTDEEGFSKACISM